MDELMMKVLLLKIVNLRQFKMQLKLISLHLSSAGCAFYSPYKLNQNHDLRTEVHIETCSLGYTPPVWRIVVLQRVEASMFSSHLSCGLDSLPDAKVTQEPDDGQTHSQSPVD